MLSRVREMTLEKEPDPYHVSCDGTTRLLRPQPLLRLTLTIDCDSEFAEKIQRWLMGENAFNGPQRALVAGHPALPEGVVDGELIDDDSV